MWKTTKTCWFFASKHINLDYDIHEISTDLSIYSHSLDPIIQPEIILSATDKWKEMQSPTYEFILCSKTTKINK